MKSLVEGECGRSNALVGLARDYGQSNQRIAPSTTRGASSLLPANNLGEQFASDFLQQKAKGTTAPNSFSLNSLAANLPQHASSSSISNTWSSEYSSIRPASHSLATQWTSQYSATRPSMESAWSAAQPLASTSMPLHQDSATHRSMWSDEFLNNVDNSLKSSSAEIKSAEWANEYSSNQQPDIWGSMEAEWEGIQRHVEMAQGSEDVHMFDDYKYEENNPYQTSDNPTVLGDQLSTAGDLGNAVLAYEAAVQKNPQDAQSWCKLGLANAENELDGKAIEAFRKCLSLDPSNQEALLALSVSLANESMENEALKHLEQWISVYEGEPVEPKEYKNVYYSVLDGDLFKKVEEKFLRAARRQKDLPDAKLQNALGVLYNLNMNYDRAIECLRIAVQCAPNNPQLWNRLGATLANSENITEAISAYDVALQMYPSYVRARYNLGIGCMHLKKFKEATEHFVSALELQKDSTGNSIWPHLRSAAIRIPGCPRELLDILDKRDLNEFKAALGRLSFQI